MAENERNLYQIIDLLKTLEHRYEDRADVCVTGTLLVLYDPDHWGRYVCPDVMVVFGVPKRLRDNFVIWEEGAVPAVVIEVTSASTRREDMRFKKDLYLRLGVGEYYVFDPRGDYLSPPLQGWHNRGKEWEHLGGEVLRSPSLGVDLRIVDGSLRLFDARTGERQYTPLEYWTRRRQEAERRTEEAERQHTPLEYWTRRRQEAERRTEEAEMERAHLLQRIADLEKTLERGTA